MILNTKINLTKKLVIFLFIFLLSAVIYFYRNILIEIFSPIVLSIIFAYICNPFIVILEKKMPRICALFLLYGLLTSLLLLFFIYIVPNFFVEAKGLAKVIPYYASMFKKMIWDIQNTLQGMGIPNELQEELNQYIISLEQLGMRYMNRFILFISNTISKVGWFFIIPILSFYFLKDKEYFRNQLLYFIPESYRRYVRKFGNEIHTVLNQFFRGQIIISLIVAGLTSIGLFLIGIKYSLVLGVFMGIFNIIPYFGPIMGAIPIMVIAILDSNKKLVYALIIIVLIQQLESSYIAPKIIGESVGIHPVYVILFLIAGGYFFGIVGMLLAVPMMLILRVLINALYKEIVYHRD